MYENKLTLIVVAISDPQQHKTRMKMTSFHLHWTHVKAKGLVNIQLAILKMEKRALVIASLV